MANPGTGREAGGQTVPPAVTEKKRDKWEKIDILGRPLGAFLTAVIVALIGWFGQRVLEDQQRAAIARATLDQRAATERAILDQRTRLYTELLSRREESESTLRKDMFAAIFKEFFSASEGGERSAKPGIDGESAEQHVRRISRLLLKLELLALNFGESLSLGPLFVELDRQIESSQKGAVWLLQRDIFRKRLRSLAQRVAERQLSALTTGGTLFEIDVPLARVIDRGVYTWPDAVFTPPPDSGPDGKPRPVTEDTAAQTAALSVIQCGETKKQFRITFSDADRTHKTVRVGLEIYDLPGTEAKGGAHGASLGFLLDFFNLPMIDNTKLSRNTRFALVLTQFNLDTGSIGNIRVAGICFPGFYASERDKPFLNEVLDALKSDNPPTSASVPPRETNP